MIRNNEYDRHYEAKFIYGNNYFSFNLVHYKYNKRNQKRRNLLSYKWTKLNATKKHQTVL